MTGIMAKARHYLSQKTLQTIYDTKVYPYLTYCNIVWTSTYPSRLKSLFMLQKKIVRIMKFGKYKEKSRPLFLSLKILNIYELNTYLMALFMYSYFSDDLPSYFTNYFKLNEMIHSHNTRTASNIYIDYKRTNYGKFSVKSRGGPNLEQTRGLNSLHWVAFLNIRRTLDFRIQLRNLIKGLHGSAFSFSIYQVKKLASEA